MRSNRPLRVSFLVMCVVIGLPASTLFAQTTTTDTTTANHYSRSPGIRVKAAIAEHDAWNQQAFSTSPPTVTETGEDTSIRHTMLVASIQTFFDMLNGLIAALQAAILNPTTPILPTVTAVTTTSITDTTAVSGGTVVTDGGATVTARGVCWSTASGPTVADSHTTDGSGTGAFTSSITGLTAGTTYHVRAYATNSVGTAYALDTTFKTTGGTTVVVPSVTTTTPTNITGSTATSGGNVTADGGATVTARGVCWSTSANPTVSNSHTTDGSGTGTFTSQIFNLNANTQYHVRAYATNSAGTAYGEDLTFTTTLGG